MDKRFEDFKLGDTYTMKKVFKKADYNIFSKISGDKNPLHHNKNYAKLTNFKKPIVPLHLVSAPLSSIAGMVFPGHRSLYLSHEIKSHMPVYFEEELIYSAKIIDMHAPKQILTVQVIVISDSSVMMSARLKIKVRDDQLNPMLLKGVKVLDNLACSQLPFTLIVGAGGEIGQSIATELAKAGRNLILLLKRQKMSDQAFIQRIKEFSPQSIVLQKDLSSKDFKDDFQKFIHKHDGFIENLIYLASPNISSDIQTQMKINYVALKGTVESCLPRWLERQIGKVIFLSSSAVQYHPVGFEDYTTAKAAATNYLHGVRNKYLPWGIKINCLAVGKVDTKFSKEMNIQGPDQMLPEEVAESVINILEDGDSKDFYYWLEKIGISKGSYGFTETKLDDLNSGVRNSEVAVAFSEENYHIKLKNFICKFFGLEHDVNWDTVGIGLVPGWDSLRHVEFILELEKFLSINFLAEEIDLTTTFNQLLVLVEKKRK